MKSRSIRKSRRISAAFLVIFALVAFSGLASCSSGCGSEANLVVPKVPFPDYVRVQVGSAELKLALCHSRREWYYGVQPISNPAPMQALRANQWEFEDCNGELIVFPNEAPWSLDLYAGLAVATELVFLDKAGVVLSTHEVPSRMIDPVSGTSSRYLDAKSASRSYGYKFTPGGGNAGARFAVRLAQGSLATYGIQVGQKFSWLAPEAGDEEKGIRDIAPYAEHTWELLKVMEGQSYVLVDVLASEEARATALTRLTDKDVTGGIRPTGHVLVFHPSEDFAERTSWYNSAPTSLPESTHSIDVIFFRETVKSQPMQYGQTYDVASMEVVGVWQSVKDFSRQTVDDMPRLPVGKKDSDERDFDAVLIVYGGSSVEGKFGYSVGDYQPRDRIWDDILIYARYYVTVPIERTAEDGTVKAIATITADLATTNNQRQVFPVRQYSFPTIHRHQSGILSIYTESRDELRKFEDWNTYTSFPIPVPMDLAFITGEGKITKIARMDAAETFAQARDYPTIDSGPELVRSVLWLPDGWLAANDVRVGDTLKLPEQIDKLKVEGE
ncbi:MAG: DUF192 domain-containing protein [Planctomycetes bacterium]|nr:DUF192 domain-containing protein [Planctomycetota bacterium]